MLLSTLNESAPPKRSRIVKEQNCSGTAVTLPVRMLERLQPAYLLSVQKQIERTRIVNRIAKVCSRQSHRTAPKRSGIMINGARNLIARNSPASGEPSQRRAVPVLG